MNEILIPVLSFGSIGLLVGLLLGVASKIFAVETDPRVDQILEYLPGANCGGCGYAGCSALAEAIAKGEAPVDACPSLNNEKLEAVAKIMGIAAKAKTPLAAFVLCSGTPEKANYKYYFDGTKTCRSVNQLNAGDKECVYACLGYGDCYEKCKFGAISLDSGIARIDPEKCTGCGLCVKECPKKVIVLSPKASKIYVACSSKDKGAAMKEKCAVGCIGCKICEKNCPVQAITVQDNLAVVDQEKCTHCGLCVEKCPKHIIVSRSE